MKTVFSNTSEVAHLWAHQLQEEAHYKGHNFYFINEVIYSYGSHYPIAQIVTFKGRKMYVLNTNYYSSTTASHCNVVRQSIPHDALVFRVNGCVSPSVQNGLLCGFGSAMDFISKKLEEISMQLDKQKRARVRDYRDNIIASISEIAKWIDFWGLAHKMKAYAYPSSKGEPKYYPSVFQYWKESNFDDISKECGLNDSDTSTRIHLFSLISEIFDLSVVNYTAKQVDKLLAKFYGKSVANQINESIKRAKIRYKRKVNRLAKQALAEGKEKLEAWHSGERNSWHVGEFYVEYGWDTALRVNNDHIETSKGINLSFDEAHRLWLIIKAFEDGKQFQHDLALDLSGRKWKLDGYHNHILSAGCHSIPFSECQYIANIMQWR